MQTLTDPSVAAGIVFIGGIIAALVVYIRSFRYSDARKRLEPTITN